MVSERETYMIDAAHPILKRVIKFNLTKKELDDIIKELTDCGYENMIIKKE